MLSHQLVAERLDDLDPIAAALDDRVAFTRLSLEGMPTAPVRVTSIRTPALFSDRVFSKTVLPFEP